MLSTNLKKLRACSGITQAELAEILGVTQQTVAKWERDKAEPGFLILKQLSKYFKVSIDELLDNEKISPPHFNDVETTLIYNYRNLDAGGQNLLLGVLDLLSHLHSKQIKNNSNVVQSNSGGKNYLTVGGNQYCNN